MKTTTSAMLHLLDNCIVTYLVTGNASVLASVSALRDAGEIVSIAGVAHYEQLRGLRKVGNAVLMARYEALVRDLDVVELSKDDLGRGADVWVEWGKTGPRPRGKDNDILIAGQGLARSAVVVTENNRDFAAAERLGLMLHRITP